MLSDRAAVTIRIVQTETASAGLVLVRFPRLAQPEGIWSWEKATKFGKRKSRSPSRTRRPHRRSRGMTGDSEERSKTPLSGRRRALPGGIAIPRLRLPHRPVQHRQPQSGTLTTSPVRSPASLNDVFDRIHPPPLTDSPHPLHNPSTPGFGLNHLMIITCGNPGTPRHITIVDWFGVFDACIQLLRALAKARRKGFSLESPVVSAFRRGTHAVLSSPLIGGVPGDAPSIAGLRDLLQQEDTARAIA